MTTTGAMRAHRPPVPRWLGHVAATVTVLVAGGLPNHPGHDFSWSPQVVVLNLVAAVLLLGRRRWPAVVLPAAVAMVLVSVPLGLFNSGTVTAVGIAVYTLSLRGMPHPRGITVTLLAAAAMLVASLAAGSAAPQHVLVILFGGALGDALHAQREHVAAITERAERAEGTREALARQRVAEDRLAIARDLHDVVAHQIAVINLHAGVASSALRSRPDDAAESLGVIRSSSRTVLREIGDLMATLRDPDAVDIGPPGLAQRDDLVRDMATYGLDVTVRVDGEPYEPSAAVDVTALRVIQEALTNAHKHGSEHRAHLLLEYQPRTLRITVTNPVPVEAAIGRAGHEGAPLGTSYGLLGTRERMDSVRGTLTAGPDGVGSWVLVAELPTEQRAPGTAADPATTEGNP
ncbi:sensor histidine kinase [Isoptericola sp. NPDC057653]|uniref:sensor histidine kinase n=1 Tax=Isoptericola sp. NPDC057653 TaxID=3346195 RepID=UPI00368E0898